MNIYFEKASLVHKKALFEWLNEPHVQEFWDNSQDHKDDILIFMNGRKQPSNYFYGLYNYWIGLADNVPYCLIMSLQEKPHYPMPALKKTYLSSQGNTYSLDFMIGNKDYVGKGLAGQTLAAFIDFMTEHFDSQADTFFIDPDVKNPKARHVYEKAEFRYVGDFIMEGNGVFSGQKTHFLVKKFSAK